MKTILRHRPSPALTISILALVVASVGTASALPGKGKVKANDLAKNAVRAKAIAEGAVTTRALAPGAVGNGQLADGSVGAEKLGSVVIVEGPTSGFNDPSAGDGLWAASQSDAQCPAGTKLLGGGVAGRPAFGFQDPQVGRVHVNLSVPINEQTWRGVAASDNGPGIGDMTAYAICID